MRPDFGDGAQGIVSGARVIDGNLKALAAVVQQSAFEQVEVIDGLLFGYLQDDAVLRKPVLSNHVARKRFVALFKDAWAGVQEQQTTGRNAGRVFNRLEAADTLDLRRYSALRSGGEESVGSF